MATPAPPRHERTNARTHERTNALQSRFSVFARVKWAKTLKRDWNAEIDAADPRCERGSALRTRERAANAKTGRALLLQLKCPRRSGHDLFRLRRMVVERRPECGDQLLQRRLPLRIPVRPTPFQQVE